MDETDYIIGEIIYDSTVKEQQNNENYEDAKRLTQDTDKIKEIMKDFVINHF